MGEERRGTCSMTLSCCPHRSAGEVSSYGDYATNGAVTTTPTGRSGRRTFSRWSSSTASESLSAPALRASIGCRNSIILPPLCSISSRTSPISMVSRAFRITVFSRPELNASITPALKAWGGTSWYNSSGQVAATANEIFADIENLFALLVTQAGVLSIAKHAWFLRCLRLRKPRLPRPTRLM